MKLHFYGVRGSLPVPSPATARYGGNTTCLAARSDSGDLLIVDAGTGLRLLGDELPQEGVCHLFLTHLHIDHLMGLPFFAPLYSKGWTLHLHTPPGGQDILERVMDGVLFPVRARDIPARLVITPYAAGTLFQVGGIRAQAVAVPHPGGGHGLRISENGWLAALSGDCELPAKVEGSGESGIDAVRRLLAGADTAIVDGQCLREDYASFEGWGHSACEDWLAPCAEAGVRHLVFTHHAINADDVELDRRERLLAQTSPRSLEIAMAREGLSLTEGSSL